MSADNGVYILVTRRDLNKKEYRVKMTWASEIEGLTIKPNHPASRPELNLARASRIFGESKVFNDRKIAEGYAMRMLDERLESGQECEFGPVWLDHSTIHFPKWIRASHDLEQWGEFHSSRIVSSGNR